MSPKYAKGLAPNKVRFIDIVHMLKEPGPRGIRLY